MEMVTVKVNRVVGERHTSGWVVCEHHLYCFVVGEGELIGAVTGKVAVGATFLAVT